MDTWQTIVVILALAGILIWAVWLVKNYKLWGYSIAPLTYLLNVLLYNLSSIANLLCSKDLDAWSHIVRIHSIIVFIGVGLILLIPRRLWIHRP